MHKIDPGRAAPPAARTLYAPPVPARVRCPACGGADVRMVWKAVRPRASESTASYACGGCHHYWVGAAPG